MNFINKKEISAKVLRCLAAGLSDGGGQLALLSNLKRNIQAKKGYFQVLWILNAQKLLADFNISCQRRKKCKLVAFTAKALSK